MTAALRHIAAALAVAAACGLAARPAAAESDPDELVAAARQAMVRLDFERAIRLLERAEAAGRSRREQLIVIYRSLADSRGSLGDADAAEADFRRLLALDPAAELPPGSSPKLTAPFQSARAFMKLRPPLDIACQRRPDRDDALLSVVSDPLGLVTAARLTRTDGGGAVSRGKRRSGKTKVELAVPSGVAPGDLACAALDRHGNELARAALTSAAARPAPAVPAPGDPSEILTPTDASPRPPSHELSRAGAGPAADRDSARQASVEDEPPTRVTKTTKTPPPIYMRWWIWGAGALAAAGVSAYFAVQLQADEDEWRDLKRNSPEVFFPDAVAVQKRGERRARNANIATATAAGLAAVSIGLLVWDLVRDEPHESSLAVGATPLPEGGAAASLHLAF